MCVYHNFTRRYMHDAYRKVTFTYFLYIRFTLFYNASFFLTTTPFPTNTHALFRYLDKKDCILHTTLGTFLYGRMMMMALRCGRGVVCEASVVTSIRVFTYIPFFSLLVSACVLYIFLCNQYFSAKKKSKLF